MDEEKREQRTTGRRFDSRKSDTTNIQQVIKKLEEKLQDSIQPEALSGLNSFERRLIHRHFDHNKDIQTRTYRKGDNFTLYVYPVGNLERFAKEKAREVFETGLDIDLPPMGSYERYIVHAALKDMDGIETASLGEGGERHVQIVSKKFGRGLKKIVKKIKLF